MELTLGPIAYHWSADRKRSFYASIAKCGALGTVYLGEVICSKRMPYFDHDIPDVINLLERSGKRIILSSLAEVMLPRERKATADLAAMDVPEIEINNAAGLFERAGRPHRIGPFLNAYNEATIEWMAAQGATHVCLPSELPAEAIGVAAKAAAALGLGVEVQVFGRAPLAVSARCYHARAHGRTKDNCRFVCEDDPDGMPLATGDGRTILRVNGIQTQSESYVSLLDDLPRLRDMGVTHARLMPQDVDMSGVADVFRGRLDGSLDTTDASEVLAALCHGKSFSNGFFHGVAGYRRIASQAESV